MSAVEASCPACGALVTFRIATSLVVVCEFCHSLVARGDRKLEDLGKMADLFETGSPLEVGLRGSYRGTPFELTGRAQLGHQAGGIWDEWYAAFEDGRWGWLAEAQGRYYLTFQQSLGDQSLLTPFQLLEVGHPVPAIPSSTPLTVAEKGVGRPVAAQGEIPYRLNPGDEYYYADLAGPQGEFATLDYSDSPPLLFSGREVTLAELGFPDSTLSREREARHIRAIQLSCPQCGGPLELRAPDKSERVCCPNCAALLDVNNGKLEFLKALKPWKIVPAIPLGSEGEFDGGRLTVIGFMQRSVEFEKVRYYWEEYLLYNPAIGFRWLVRSDDHWSFVQPVSAGAVVHDGRTVRFSGRRFKLFQDATARVEHVLGEFYWKVTLGELVRAADYIHPPYILSKEMSMYEASTEPDEATQKRRRQKKRAAAMGEINWSLGTYVKPRQIEKTFGIRGLPRSSKVAPNQPFLLTPIYRNWLLLMAATVVVALFVMVTGSRQKVFESSFDLQPVASPDATHVIFTDPFELKSWRNIKVTARSNVDNSWLYVEGDLIEESTGLVQAFSLPVEYYHGVSDGESWREGGQSTSVHLSALPSGRYTLRLEVSRERWQQPNHVGVSVEQGMPRILHVIITMCLLTIAPVLVGIYHFSFEKRRWEDSDYSPFH